MNRLVSGAIGVEVPMLPNVSKVYFPDIPDLRKKRIKHIDVYHPDVIGLSSPKWMDLVEGNYSDINITIVEYSTKMELIKSLPVTELNQNGNRLYINKVIDLPRTYLDITNVPSTFRGCVMYFVFWYDEPRVWGNVSDLDKLEVLPLEITLKSARTYFDANNDLKNRRFQNLLLSFPTITPKGNAGLQQNFAKGKFLTLKRGNLEFFYRVPLIVFYQSSDYYFLRLQDIIFDMQNSYIETIGTDADDLKTVFFNAIISK